MRFSEPEQGEGQVFRVDDKHSIDLRRPAYYYASVKKMEATAGVIVVADTFSMPGALSMMMGFALLLLKTDYTPGWGEGYVRKHPCGALLPDLRRLVGRVEALL